MFWFWSKTGFPRNFLLKGAILCQRSSIGIGTWSPLATAFNTRPGTKLSVSFSSEKSGLFGKHELKTYDGFFLLKENVITATDALVQETLDSNRTRKMVDIFDELSDTLCGVADLAEFVRLAHPDSQFSYAAENACIALSGLVEKLNTNRELYNVLRDTVKNGDKIPTTAVDDHVASLFLFDFEQCGIHLSEENRKQVVSLNDYILQIGQRFMSGAVNSRAVKIDLVPQHVRNLFGSENGDLLVGGLYTDAENEVAREVAYKVFLSPDREQEYLLDELLASRYKLAQLCGFSTYSHRALKSSLAESPSNVWEFLVSLSDSLKMRVDEDFNFMLKIKNEINPSAMTLSAWDIPFITQKAKRNWLKVENAQFSPYFSLGTCMDGLNNLMESLYGISFVVENTVVGETWAPDIYKLAVMHRDEGLLGHIYCDFYERENKPNQDCHFTIRGGKKRTDGNYQNPIVVVMLNVPSPKWNSPSLLTPAMVDNLFHEMGHAMHSMLARTDHQHVTGTRCTMDFAEVPSVLMEYFASDPRVLRTFAKHYETQEPMPEDMILKLCDSKHVFAASDMQLQVFYSLLDQRYHGPHPLTGTTTEVLANTHNEYYGIPYVPNTAWQLRFSHLVGYGAKYYSYLMSRAVASLIWENLFEKNPFSSNQGERYRRECLAHGGGKPPHSLIKDFLQFDPTPQTLATALINDLDRHKVL